MKNGNTRAKILVTRKLPEAAEQAISATFEAELRTEDTGLSADDIVSRING
jgi:hypothetical protein